MGKAGSKPRDDQPESGRSKAGRSKPGGSKSAQPRRIGRQNGGSHDARNDGARNNGAMKFTIESDLSQQREIQKRILDAVEEAGFHPDAIFAVKISLEEGLIN